MARVPPAPRARLANRTGRAPRPAVTIFASRWWRIALLVAAVLLGLPLAHALFGEAIALLGGAVAFGFMLGRWTAPGR